MKLSELKKALDSAAAQAGYDDPEVVMEDGANLAVRDIQCIDVGVGCVHGSLVIVPE